MSEKRKTPEPTEEEKEEIEKKVKIPVHEIFEGAVQWTGSFSETRFRSYGFVREDAAANDATVLCRPDGIVMAKSAPVAFNPDSGFRLVIDLTKRSEIGESGPYNIDQAKGEYQVYGGYRRESVPGQTGEGLLILVRPKSHMILGYDKAGPQMTRFFVITLPGGMMYFLNHFSPYTVMERCPHSVDPYEASQCNRQHTKMIKSLSQIIEVLTKMKNTMGQVHWERINAALTKPIVDESGFFKP